MKVMNFRPDLSSTPWIQSDLLFSKKHRLVFILNTLFGGSLLVKQPLNCRDSTASTQTQNWGRRAQSEQGCHQGLAWQQERPCFAPDSPQQENASIHPLLRKAISMLKDAPSLIVSMRKNSTVLAVLDEVEVRQLPTTISG